MSQSSDKWPNDSPDRPRPRRSKRAANGDCTRSRRFADPIRQRYYSRWRQERFARRMRGDSPPN